MRKIEVITDQDHLRELLDIFENHRLDGFTAIEIAHGKGAKQGLTLGLGLSGSRGIYVFSVCQAATASALEGDLRTFVRRNHGIALISPI
ncbi:MAG: hypothetical protein KC420_15145, partial [Myxococcales bacterium]|nr:hypothetical protein [Myxococcales bacterium]